MKWRWVIHIRQKRCTYTPKETYIYVTICRIYVTYTSRTCHIYVCRSRLTYMYWLEMALGDTYTSKEMYIYAKRDLHIRPGYVAYTYVDLVWRICSGLRWRWVIWISSVKKFIVIVERINFCQLIYEYLDFFEPFFFFGWHEMALGHTHTSKGVVHIRQKRPTYTSKETYIYVCGSRLTYM